MIENTNALPKPGVSSKTLQSDNNFDPESAGPDQSSSANILRVQADIQSSSPIHRHIEEYDGHPNRRNLNNHRNRSPSPAIMTKRHKKKHMRKIPVWTWKIPVWTRTWICTPGPTQACRSIQGRHSDTMIICLLDICTMSMSMSMSTNSE